MTDTRRGGGERRGAGAQGRAGTRLKVEGDVVMADADENPKRRAQDQRRGRGEMGRRSTGAQASAEEATGQSDARRIVGTASSVVQNEQQMGSSTGMWYSDGAERKVLTGENGGRQGSDLQERRTGRRIQYSDKLVPGSERLLGWAGGKAGVLESGAVEPRHSGAPVDWLPGCAGCPPTWYVAAKLSAWQDGAALKTLSLRAPCSEGLTTPALGGHRRHGTPTRCNGVRTLSMRLGSAMQKQRREFDKRLPDVLSVFIRRMRWLKVRRQPTAMPDLGQGHSPVHRYTPPPPNTGRQATRMG